MQCVILSLKLSNQIQIGDFMKKTFAILSAGLLLTLSGSAYAFDRVDCQIDPASDQVALPAGVRADEGKPSTTFSLVRTGMVKGQETYELTDNNYGTRADVYFLKQETQKLSFSSNAFFIIDQHRTILLISSDSGVSYQTHGGSNADSGKVTVKYACILK